MIEKIYQQMADMVIIGFNLQLFADGGDGGDGGAGAPAAAAESGVPAPAAGEKRRGKPDPFANVQFGIDESAAAEQPAAAPERKSFQELIKGDYKQDFEQEIQNIVGKRLKNSKAAEETLDKLGPTLEIIASKYGLQRGQDGKLDLDALAKAVGDDDELYEEKAAERGMSVDTYKLVHKLETEAKQREEQDKIAFEEQQRRQNFERLVQQAEAAKQVYPGFDLNQEIMNPDFLRLTSVGVDARTAYEVIHKDQIIGGAMQYAAQTGASKVAASVAANGRRPVENGLGSSSPATVRITDPRTMTKAQRAELRRRVARGDKVVF